MKNEKVDKFLDILDDHISNKIADANRDAGDSWGGMYSYQSEKKLKEALYDMLDIEIITDDDE